MCARNVIEPDEAEIRSIIDEAVKHLGETENVKTGEIFPTNNAPVLALGENSMRPYIMKWGFPHFRGKGVIINARAETVLEKRTFRESVLSRRCIIPASGFYEWKSNETKHKDKYLFTLPQSGVLYIAGFYNSFIDDGIKTNKFIIITTAANKSMSDIHNRMPLVLQKDDIRPWLSNSYAAFKMLSNTPAELEKVMV